MVLFKFSNEDELDNVPVSVGLLNKLRREILSGNLRPGQKLTEQNLCEKYDLSRTPVREALKQLESDGLVEGILNRGFFVVGLTRQDYEDLFELRKIGEVQAVKWAIERMSEDELDVLEETFEFMEFYTRRNDVAKMLVINNGFHQAIYEAAHNTTLKKQLTTYQNCLKYVGEDMVRDENYLAAVLEEHRAIFKACKERDIRAGVEAVENHLNKSKERKLGNA